MSNWKSRATPAEPTASSGWRDRAEAVEPDVSMTESALRGLASGASLGFADEIAGGAEALWEAAKGNPAEFGKLYEQARNESRAAYKSAQDANPATYGIGEVGGALGTMFVPGLNVAKGASLAKTAGAAALQGGAMGVGGSQAESVADVALDGLKGAAVGGAGGAAGYGLAKAASAVPGMFHKAGNLVQDGAEQLAVNATGATGAQSAKFAPKAGRELLDRGWVKFGDDAEGIAERVRSSRLKAGESIGNSLQTLDDKGTTASVDDIVNVLQSKVDELGQSPGNEGVIKQIQKEIDNLYERGQSALKLSDAEIAKRNFQGQVNYFSPEAEKKGATHVADAFRRQVEDAATVADPALAKQFMDDKLTYGLAAPIEEAAQKRANSLNQSPFGGLGDFVAGGVGSVGGLPGAAASVAARRFVGPRLASSGAITADAIGGLLKRSPQALGRYGPVLSAAISRGPQAFASTHFLLQQTDPGYREQIKAIEGENE